MALYSVCVCVCLHMCVRSILLLPCHPRLLTEYEIHRRSRNKLDAAIREALTLPHDLHTHTHTYTLFLVQCVVDSGCEWVSETPLRRLICSCLNFKSGCQSSFHWAFKQTVSKTLQMTNKWSTLVISIWMCVVRIKQNWVQTVFITGVLKKMTKTLK